MKEKQDNRGFIEKAASLNKNVDAVTMVAGLVLMNGVVFTLGLIGYFTSRYIEGSSKKNREKKENVVFQAN